jgi:hypothetical protein
MDLAGCRQQFQIERLGGQHFTEAFHHMAVRNKTAFGKQPVQFGRQSIKLMDQPNDIFSGQGALTSF